MTAEQRVSGGHTEPRFARLRRVLPALIGVVLFALAVVVLHRAIAHSTGFATLVAGAVRYRFYVAEGLTLPEVAQVQVLFGLTYSLGFATLCGLALVAEPQVLSPISAVPPWVWRGLGLTLIGFVL